MNSTTIQPNASNASNTEGDDVIVQNSTGILRAFLVVVISLSAIIIYNKKPALKAVPFNFYIIFLLGVNVFHNALDIICSILEMLEETWIWSNQLCTFYIFERWTLSGTMVTIHLAIALSRLWAAYFPDNYRRNNTVKLTKQICAGTVIVLAICCLPYALIDEYPNKRTPEIDSCRSNGYRQPIYVWFLQVLTNFAPFFLTFIVCILILWKLKQVQNAKKAKASKGTDKKAEGKSSSKTVVMFVLEVILFLLFGPYNGYFVVTIVHPHLKNDELATALYQIQLLNGLADALYIAFVVPEFRSEWMQKCIAFVRSKRIGTK